MTNLSTLPTELLDLIAQRLPYTSALALSWTCRRLYADMDKSFTAWSASSRLDTIFDLLILEKWPAFAQHLTCCYCHKILPQSCFTLRQTHRYPKEHFNSAYMLKAQQKLRERMRKGGEPLRVTRTRRSFGGSGEADLGVETAGRLCIQCGVRDGRYHKGELFHFPLDADDSGASASSVSDDDAHGTGIVCRICGEFKVCEADSAAASRRTCWDCLPTVDPDVTDGVALMSVGNE